MNGPLDLGGRVAIVTGGARGIGRATTQRLARHGASVAACDRSPVPGVEPVDVRDDDATAEFVSAVVARFGRVDVLVNNAGGSFCAPMLDVNDKGEAMLIAENFTQVTHLIRRVVDAMPAGGSIVNITSVEAHQASPGFAIYAAMKAAVANLTRSLALELADRGIRVNAVAPDAVSTGGEHDARGQMGASGIRFEPVTTPPLGFLGDPEDVAGAVLYLASDLARFVTGTTIHVDGGTHAAGGWRRTPDHHGEEPWTST